MKIHTYAGSQQHFANHLIPIYNALPDDIRGNFHARSHAAEYAHQQGITVTPGIPRGAELVMVASFEDHRAVAPSPTILLNHGAAQTYRGDPSAADHPSYSGGRNRERVQLFLCPSERDAEICRIDGAMAVAVGVPKMDRHHHLPKVDSWSEYLFHLGMHPTFSKPEDVRKALHPMETTWKSFETCACARSFTIGEILGQGFKRAVEQVLALHGWERQWIRTVSVRGTFNTGSSDGLVSYLRGVAEEGFGSYVPQSFANLFGRTTLSSSGLLQPCPSARCQSRGKQSRLSTNSSREEYPQDALCTRPFTSRCLSWTEGRTLVQEVQNQLSSQEILGQSREASERATRKVRRPVVAISHHCDVHVCPETRSAFSYYRQSLIDLARDPDRSFDLLGHAHPRWTLYMRKFWTKLGVEFVDTFDEVLDRADCYVIDNSSSMYEAASIGLPVLTLNAPWYRRDVHHGLRFWEAIPGLQVDLASDLHSRIAVTLDDWDIHRDLRENAVKLVYGDLCDGKATERAITAIQTLLASHP